MRNPLEDVTGSMEDLECCWRIEVRADEDATLWRLTSLLAVSPDEEDDEDEATDAW